MTNDGPYAALFVVELGERISAGATGSLLAQLGADVVVVEPPENSISQKWRNRPIATAGKKSIVLDKKDKGDQLQIHRLIALADVVITSSDICAFDAEAFRRSKTSGPVICDISAFGHTGPLAGRPWSEHQVAAFAGNIDTTGMPGSPPVAIGADLLEMHAAVLSTAGILSALRVRRHSGWAQTVELALYDVAVTSMLNFVALHLAGDLPVRSGNRHPLLSPWGAYRASDGWIVLCCGSDDHWTTLCRTMEKMALIEDPRFASLQARVKNSTELDEVIGGWTSHRTVEQCERLLIGAGIACGPVYRLDQLSGEANIRHREFLQCFTVDTGQTNICFPRSPIRIAGDWRERPVHIPRKDEHREVLLRKMDEDPAAQRSPNPDDPHCPAPFHGLRVIELGQYTVAPMASRLLGSLGAEVIKVEPPRGDAIRAAHPQRADGSSYAFAMSNTDKCGVVLDLRTPSGKNEFWRLLKSADAVVENLKPGSLAKLGFDKATLAKQCPHLIQCSNSGFGHFSAYPDRAAFDTIIQAMSGLMSFASIEGVPIKTGNSTSDILGGEFGLLALMVGFDLREAGAELIDLDISMQEASLWATQYEWQPSVAHAVPTLIKAKDGYVAVQSAPECTADGPFTDVDRDTLVQNLGGTAQAVPVLTVPEVLRQEQTTVRNLLVQRQTAAGEAWTVFANPIRLSLTPPDVKTVMGKLGSTDKYVWEEMMS